NARHELVDDAERVADDRRLVALRMRALVDPGERGEHEFRPLGAHAPNDFLDDVTVDVEPAANIAAEVRARDARRRAQSAEAANAERGDASAGREAAAD